MRLDERQAALTQASGELDANGGVCVADWRCQCKMKS